MRRGTLTSVDAVIGAVILDAQNVALHIPFSTKETLAARWQVLLVIPTRVLGLIVIPFLVTGLARRDFASEDCSCFRAFWWSWISDCGDNHRDDDGLCCFYVYYSLRWVMALRSSCKALYRTGRWHRGEKCTRLSPPLADEVVTKLSKWYTKSPSTVSYSCLIYALYSITSMVVAEITIQDFELRASSSVYSVGQIIAIVIAGSTVLRALWEFIGMFNDAVTKGFPDLVFTLLRRVYDYFVPSKTDGEKDTEQALEAANAEEDYDSWSDATSEEEARPPPGPPNPPIPSSLPLTPSPPTYHFFGTTPRLRPQVHDFGGVLGAGEGKLALAPPLIQHIPPQLQQSPPQQQQLPPRPQHAPPPPPPPPPRPNEHTTASSPSSSTSSSTSVVSLPPHSSASATSSVHETFHNRRHRRAVLAQRRQAERQAAESYLFTLRNPFQRERVVFT